MYAMSQGDDRFNFLESICNKITSCFFQCKLYIITIFILIRLFKDDEAQKWKAEDLATQEQFLKSYMKKKKGKDSLLLDVSDYTNGASSNNGKNIKDGLYFCLVFSV